MGWDWKNFQVGTLVEGGRVACVERVGKLHPSPLPPPQGFTLCISTNQLFLSWMFYNKPRILSKALSEFWEAF